MGWRYNGELGRRVPFSLGIYILVGEKDFKGNLTNEYVITKWPECCEGAVQSSMGTSKNKSDSVGLC